MGYEFSGQNLKEDFYFNFLPHDFTENFETDLFRETIKTLVVIVLFCASILYNVIE